MAAPTPTIPLASNFSTLNNNHRYFANHPTVQLIDRCSNAHHLKQIHAQMLRAGLFFDPFSASKLIHSSLFTDFSSLHYAHKVFDQIPHPNLYSWNLLIRAYASSLQPIHCISMFIRLLHEGREKPNKFTYPSVIKASAKLADLQLGKGVHGIVIKEGLSSDLFVGNCLINLYAECRCFDMSARVLSSMPERDVVSWNSIINGFAQNDCVDEALEFFRRMEREGVDPNDVTMVGVLSACGKKLDLTFGRWLHSYIEKNGIRLSLILGNAVLDMYTKCGSMNDARKFFDSMVEKDIISWTTMLAGYARLGDFTAARDLFDSLPSKDIATWNALISAYEQSGNPKEAIATFNELQLSKDAKPDEVTLVSTLSACSQLGAMGLGGWIHVYIKKEGVRLNCHLVTALIDMYSKCGDLQKALEVFDSVDQRDVFVWSAMIAGLGMHGRGKDAVELFSKMMEAKVKPTSVTFTNLLSACSHSGLVKEAREFFHQMEKVYKIVPGVEHYACMVDVLGRAGLLQDALELIKNMPTTLGASVWGALLGACRLHKNVELAQYACNNLLEIEPQNHGAYVLLSNIYASRGKWEMVSELRKLMKDAGLKKEPGGSLVEVNGSVHEFVVGDSTHSRSKEIYFKLEEIAVILKSVGYVPNKSQLLQLVEEEDMQEKALHLHSERLALAFGLITLGPSQPIRIVKNLRVCEDCHSVFKLVSKLYDREIVLRDRHRFHHFKGGCCSCMDYWLLALAYGYAEGVLA
ncbi:pentatricopeptide repeat-containing protein At2g29760, chloroplastic isoform X1 [Sesamum indicum]|uniref:Pentatricopeptide repeat-containing protein At2g29760, chloroplastic isoform X1 n=2 Tax=Sesamum indicum TaxID=4182 RepID=A0A8M8UXY1_SESIN|nr:pentatricopeptide repeat-containing protein At2g29760, chloroplastic isoform X1 [Sesamum indicum]